MKALRWTLGIGLLVLIGLAVAGSVPATAAAEGRSAAASASDLPILPPLSNVIDVAAGGDHTCVVTATGGAKCWGRNEYGQLGDGTTTQRSLPVDVVGLTSGVVAVEAGVDYTCALTAAGGAKCWGHNYGGKLGDGSRLDRAAPVDVVGLASGVAAIATGWDHTCAVMTDGGAKCWGRNWGGLGDGTSTVSEIPVDVVDLPGGITAITVGAEHTCAVTTGGGVKCWGENYNGQLGDGTTDRHRTPEDVTGLTSGATAITAGEHHTCVVLTDGGVKCWGLNQSGQLGAGVGLYFHITPVEVEDLTDAIAVDAGWWHNCALTTGGGVKCWGANWGRLGDGTTEESPIPVDVIGLASGVVDIPASWTHTCAVTSLGGVKCWGDDEFSQLGAGRSVQRNVPGTVAGFTSGVAAISVGEAHTCALTRDGGVKCWGKNGSARLGDGTFVDRSTAVDAVGLTSGVTVIGAGLYHGCAVTTEGGAKCWGRGFHATPIDVVGLTGAVTAITGGEERTSALTTAGGVLWWLDKHSEPKEKRGLATGVAGVDDGQWHTCVVLTDGGVKCWGDNRYGQLGDGSTIDRSRVEYVSGLTSGAVGVSAGWTHTCAVMADGGVKCWGDNASGQLGDGTAKRHKTPVDVLGLTEDVVAVAAGGQHTCVVTTAGRAQCWGGNGAGQLGDGTKVSRTTPTDVLGLTHGAIAISTGEEHTCALTTDGEVRCWGDNFYGQLEDGVPFERTTPVDVVDWARVYVPVIFGQHSTSCGLGPATGCGTRRPCLAQARVY